MPTLTHPTSPYFAASKWWLAYNTQVSNSPLSQSTQSIELAGARWKAELNLPQLTIAQLVEWEAFFSKLRGRAGRFYLTPLGRKTAFGVATGVPVVSGASQIGVNLVTSGWTPSTTNILLVGDYISFNVGLAGRELHRVVESANSNASGIATLKIEPPIRTSPANGAAITHNNATAIMALDDDDIAITMMPGGFATVDSIKCTESWL